VKLHELTVHQGNDARDDGGGSARVGGSGTEVEIPAESGCSQSVEPGVQEKSSGLAAGRHSYLFRRLQMVPTTSATLDG
jgi:hypothetical protein